MIKKRYKTPMAKFHKLNASVILAGSGRDDENLKVYNDEEDYWNATETGEQL